MIGLGLKITQSSSLNLEARVAELFTGGAEGAWYILSPSNMFTDRAGTTPVTALDDFVGYITDSSGNANDFVAVSDAGRALYKTDGTNGWIQLDKVDDNYSTTFASPIVGTMLIGTRKGTIHLEVDIPAGSFSLTPNAAYFPGNTVTDIVLKNGYMTDAELANAKAWLASRGSPLVYTPTGVDLVYGFRWGALISNIYFESCDLSGATSLYFIVRGSAGITSVDFSGQDMALLTSARSAFQLCANLASITVDGVFDNAPCTDYTTAFQDCALNQASVDALLVSINNANTSNGTLGLDGGTNATPSATGQAAADALRARGWTVNLNGYPA